MNFVRVTPNNVAHCVQLAKELVDASQFDVPFDWDYAYAMGFETLDDPTYYSCMAVEDGSYCGMVLGRITTFYFNPTRFGVEDAWFVRPGTRDRTRAAVSLMYGFIGWCRKQGAVHVQASDTASIEPLSVDQLYRRIGFKRYGAVYRYVIGDEPCGQKADNQID